MGKTKELLADALKMIALGALVMVGMRVAEWVIPAPEVMVIVCMGDEVSKIDTCQSLNDLVKKHAG
jgi:hypothetical protein